MGNEEVFCPYCGPWNGHPDGVEMREDGNGYVGPDRFGYPEQFWYYCPVCGSESPCEESREAARAAALQRFTPPQKPLTLDELREMDGEPVWCEEIKIWGIVSCSSTGYYAGVPFLTGDAFAFDIAKRGLTTYKTKPESAKGTSENREG